jgi:hypothetical protein
MLPQNLDAKRVSRRPSFDRTIPATRLEGRATMSGDGTKRTRGMSASPQKRIGSTLSFLFHTRTLGWEPRTSFSIKAAISVSMEVSAASGCVTSTSPTCQYSTRCSQSENRSRINGRCSDSIKATIRSADSRSTTAHCRGNRSQSLATRPRFSRAINTTGDNEPTLSIPRSMASARDLATQPNPARAAWWLKSSSAKRLR